jgi:hypothetical protein
MSLIRDHQDDEKRIVCRGVPSARHGKGGILRRSGPFALLISVTALAIAVAGCGGTNESQPSSMTGTWIGSGEGFVNGSPREGLRERLVIREPVGRAFAGTAEWRVADGPWSKPETIHGTIETDGEVLVIDGDGFLIGRLDGDEMELSYLEHGRVGGGADYAIDYQLKRIE